MDFSINHASNKNDVARSKHQTNRRRFFKYAGAAVVGTGTVASGAYMLFPKAASAAAAPQHARPKNPSGVNIVLVHGAFADGSSWSRVIPHLQAEGHTVIAVQSPLTSLADDVTNTRRVLETLSGPTILVGHSYGGVVISNAGTDAPGVAGLVYIAAIAPDEGESATDVTGQFAPADGAQYLYLTQYGFALIKPEWFPWVFAQDVDLEKARVLAAVQKPIAYSCNLDKSGPVAWKKLPSWYIVSANDRAINPEAERWMAQRIGATMTELPSSHASLVSHPQEVSKTIQTAVEHSLKA